MKIKRDWAALMGALWLLVAVVLVGRNSRWTWVATVALTIQSGWRLVAAARSLGTRLWPESRPVGDVISPPLPARKWRPLFHLACAGALINLTMLAQGTHRPVAAGLIGAAAAIMVLSRFSGEELTRLVERHRRWSLAVALLLVITSLIRWGSGHWSQGTEEPYAREASASTRSKDHLSFRGVILYVEKQAERVVPPSPVALAKGAADPAHEPLVIPFSGVYWFMRAPDRLPPATSMIQHGSPDELFYRAADYRPLTMEAHQQLGRLIDIACCSAVDLDLLSVDRWPGSVQVELLLTDTAGVGPRLSLGLAPAVKTQLAFGLVGAGTQVETSLHFPISQPRFGRFDEITVRFHLAQMRNRQSARMAIQRFTLRPRGAAAAR